MPRRKRKRLPKPQKPPKKPPRSKGIDVGECYPSKSGAWNRIPWNRDGKPIATLPGREDAVFTNGCDVIVGPDKLVKCLSVSTRAGRFAQAGGTLTVHGGINVPIYVSSVSMKDGVTVLG